MTSDDVQPTNVVPLRPSDAYYARARPIPMSAVALEYERRVRAARAFDRGLAEVVSIFEPGTFTPRQRKAPVNHPW